MGFMLVIAYGQSQYIDFYGRYKPDELIDDTAGNGRESPHSLSHDSLMMTLNINISTTPERRDSSSRVIF
jgi:hypothetical protein